MYKKIQFIKPFSYANYFHAEEGRYLESEQIETLQGFVDEGYAIFVEEE
ncbi:hypothetical protein V1503_24175 [Bacillus sp. SCS-151]